MKFERKFDVALLVGLATSIIGFSFWLASLRSEVTDMRSSSWFSQLRESELKLFTDELKKAKSQATESLALSTDGLPVGSILIGSAQSIRLSECWMVCNGQQLPAADYKELAKTLGTAWGGSQFEIRLPNLTGRFLIGAESDPKAKSPVVASALADRKVGTYEDARIPDHTHEKGSLRVAGGTNPNTAEIVFKTGAAEIVPGANILLYPSGPGNVDKNGQRVCTIDTIGETGPEKLREGTSLNESLRPSNAAVVYFIKVK